MRRTFVPLALVALLVASAASAELSQKYKDWPNSPTGFLLTPSERKAYAQLQNDAEAQAFIDLFWAKRDPDLNTVQNEFRLDFDLKVAAADMQFSNDKLKGSLSDRGKALILLGKPLQVQNVAPGSPSEEPTRPGILESGASQVWLYTKDGKPPVKKGDEIQFVFTETHPGDGDFVLDHGDRRNKQAFKLLEARAEQLVVNPKLTEVPKVGLLPGTKAATPAQEAVFDVQPRPWPQGAVVLTSSGVQSESLYPVWVFVQLPDAAAPATEAVGRVRKAEGGETAGSFASPVNALSVPGGRAYEFSLPVAPGTWKVDLALLNAAGPVAVTTADAKNDTPPTEGPYISPVYWGAEARQSAQAHLGDAFHLGGMHLLPVPDNRYKSVQNITYAVYVVRPSLDEQQQPKIELSVALYSGGKKNDEQPYAPITGVKIANDMWVFGQMLPLSGFRRGTEFELRVSFRDAKTGLGRAGSIPFTVVKEEAPAPAATPAPASSPEPKK